MTYDMNDKTPLVDIEYTADWWLRTCADEKKLPTYAQKLFVTEFNGYQDNMEAIQNWTTNEDKLARRILTNTAKDELDHSRMIMDFLGDYNIFPECVYDSGSKSLYWDYVDRAIVDLQTACAVFHFGERLAAEKFQTMYNLNCAPYKFQRFLEEALPDEQYHANSFGFLAGQEALDKVYQYHLEALKLIIRK